MPKCAKLLMSEWGEAHAGLPLFLFKIMYFPLGSIESFIKSHA